MNKRPELNLQLDEETFRSFYYLKEELVSFCKAHDLPSSGGKIEITNRIAHFLSTGKTLPATQVSKPKADIGIIAEDALIEANFVCSEKHRTFFKEKIGKGFSFNVAFQKWLKANTGKTYAQAIEAYHSIIEEKKLGKTTIDKQFEYNTYIRAFFENNKGLSLDEAIQCWKYKKSMPGHNRYEETDLLVLNSR